jgi:hypothetical protein
MFNNDSSTKTYSINGFSGNNGFEESGMFNSSPEFYGIQENPKYETEPYSSSQLFSYGAFYPYGYVYDYGNAYNFSSQKLPQYLVGKTLVLNFQQGPPDITIAREFVYERSLPRPYTILQKTNSDILNVGSYPNKYAETIFNKFRLNVLIDQNQKIIGVNYG